MTPPLNTYCLSEECANRLRAIAAKRRKPPAVQARINGELYAEVAEFCQSRDSVREFIEYAIRCALDVAKAKK